MKKLCEDIIYHKKLRKLKENKKLKEKVEINFYRFYLEPKKIKFICFFKNIKK